MELAKYNKGSAMMNITEKIVNMFFGDAISTTVTIIIIFFITTGIVVLANVLHGRKKA